MSNPTVSVLIPAYKERWFEQSIKSAVSQTFDDMEILVSDDSKGDFIKDITMKYQQLDSRVQYFKNPNPDGIGTNNGNLLLSKAKGKYVKYLFDDDFLLPKSVEILVGLLECNPTCKLAFHHRYFVDENDKIISGPTFISGKGSLIVPKETFFDLIIARCQNLIGEPPNILFERKAFDSIKEPFSLSGFRTKYFSDVFLFINFVSRDYQLIGSSEFSSAFRHSTAQNSNESSPLYAAKIFERDFMIRWAAHNGFLNYKQVMYSRALIEANYRYHLEVFPELSRFLDLKCNYTDGIYLSKEYIAALSYCYQLVAERVIEKLKKR